MIADGTEEDFSFTPYDNGVYTLTYSVTDDDGVAGTDTVVVTVNNVTATFVLDPVTTINEGEIATLTGTITDPGALDTLALDIDWSDPDDPATAHFDLVAATHDAAADFSITNDNPNGVWSYGYRNALGSGFTPYDRAQSPIFGSWTTVDGSSWNRSAGTQPSVYHNDSTADWTYGTVDLFAGELALHPGSGGQYSVVRFAAPSAGVYDLDCEFAGRDTYAPYGGTTTDVHVLVNDVSVFDESVNGYLTTKLFAGQISLGAGDTVDFAVGYGSDAWYAYDTTALSATLTQVPELSAGATFTSTTDDSILTVNTVDPTTGEITFTVPHQYLDDNPSGTPSDTYPIHVTVTDDDTDGAISVGSKTNADTGHIYHLIKADDGVSGVTWTEAETAAVALGGHLVTINDAAENSWILSNFSDYYLWIGLNDVTTEGTFAWSSGEPVTFTNWYPGEPNDSGDGEDFVHIYNFESGQYKWNDRKDLDYMGSFPVFGVAEIIPGTVTVNNVAPVADAGADQTVNEGDLVTLSGAFTDVGVNDGHKQEWSVVSSNGQVVTGQTTDNLAGDSDGSGGSSFSFTPDDNGTYTVTYTVTDDDGGIHSDDAVITVNNVAPSATITGPPSGVRGETLLFTLEALDVSSVDQVREFLFTIDWDLDDDSAPIESLSATTPTTVEHVYTKKGSYTVGVQATDKDDGASLWATTVVEISAAKIKNGKLKVGGTDEADTIVLTEGSVVVTVNGEHVGTFEPTAGIEIFGLGGPDVIVIDYEIYQDAMVWGGAGDDYIQGGGGRNTLLGEEGDDTLVGGPGFNRLEGWDGDDTFEDRGGHNTIIGGSGSNTFLYGGGINCFETLPGQTAPDVFADAYSVVEGSTLSVPSEQGVLVNDVDPHNDPLSVDLDSIVGPDNGSLTFEFSDGSFTYVPNDGFNGLDSFRYQATNGVGTSSYAVVTIRVENAPPTIETITAPVEPTAVDMPVDVNLIFSDAGVLDTHTVQCEWGDGATSSLELTDGSRDVILDHTYAAAGVYTLSFTVTDGEGDSDVGWHQYVVVYDPNGGFVTGGGWIMSPQGAYVDDPTLTGKANFGFVSKYKKGADTPTGQTNFQFKVADLGFSSTDYQWLVIAGANAKYKGRGTINGEGDYGFMLTAIDGQYNGGDADDTFRIKIWNRSDDAVLYDNQLGADDASYDGTALGGGSVVVHKDSSALTAAAPAPPSPLGTWLSDAMLAGPYDAALAHWQQQGVEASDIASLQRVDVRVASLDRDTLGLASNTTNLIWIDRDAAGFGWSVTADDCAGSGMDLLSTLTHELGHMLGLEHDLMGEPLVPGLRFLPPYVAVQERAPASYAAGVDAALQAWDASASLVPATTHVRELRDGDRMVNPAIDPGLQDVIWAPDRLEAAGGQHIDRHSVWSDLFGRPKWSRRFEADTLPDTEDDDFWDELAERVAQGRREG